MMQVMLYAEKESDHSEGKKKSNIKIGRLTCMEALPYRPRRRGARFGALSPPRSHATLFWNIPLLSRTVEGTLECSYGKRRMMKSVLSLPRREAHPCTSEQL